MSYSPGHLFGALRGTQYAVRPGWCHSAWTASPGLVRNTAPHAKVCQSPVYSHWGTVTGGDKEHVAPRVIVSVPQLGHIFSLEGSVGWGRQIAVSLLAGWFQRLTPGEHSYEYHTRWFTGRIANHAVNNTIETSAHGHRASRQGPEDGCSE